VIYNLNIKETPALADVGGKAKSLIETSQAGFNVPDGFILSVQFFEPWIKTVKAADSWKKMVKDPTKENCDALKQASDTLYLTKEQQKQIEFELEGFPSNSLFAVRSSSPEEDLEEASFAGIYESILGVPRDQIFKAVKECFISIFDERVIYYKKQNQLDFKNPEIAVIVQCQIASEVSGVGFSINPVTNYYDECVINANYGLGDTVVDGRISADQFIVDKITNSIIEKNAGTKEYTNYLNLNGGLQKKQTLSPEKLCLTDKQIAEICTLTAEVEQYYKKPIDIEWAYEKDQLFLLQARPVTGYVKLPPEILTIPGEPKKLYADFLLTAQGLTDSLSPLGEGIAKLYYTDGMNAMGMDSSLASCYNLGCY